MTLNSKTRSKCVAIAALALAVALSGCAGGTGTKGTGSEPAAGESIRLILGHGAAPGNPRSDAALEFEKIVEEKSNNTIDIQIVGQESVGSDSEMITSVTAGTLDLTINSQGPFASVVPEAALIGLPFLFDSVEDAYAVIDSDIMTTLSDKAETQGLHVLGYWDNGMRDITNSKRPINTPADVEGLKIRTPDDAMTISIFNALKANPTPLAFGELYLALQQGAVDGQENPVTNVKSSKLNEVQKYLAETGHKYETNPFLVSSKKWESLTEDQRKIIQEAADQARDIQRKLMNEQISTIYQEFEAELEITHPDKEAFRTATAAVYDEWKAKYPEFYQTITAAAAGK
jgi:tripartite ATP-independent transporter DctP family solute receptor